MAILLSDELRLFYALGLIVIPFGCAWRFTRRWTDDRLEAAGDAFVLFYAIQYLAVCLPGLAGVLTPVSLAITALILSAILLLLSRRSVRPAIASAPQFDRLVLTAGIFFVVAYCAAAIYHQADLPPLANDALTYHLPAAVQWLTTHRLSLFDCWFFNPANTYSPLAGSTFIAYLIAPMGNDVLARFVEAGALLFLFFAIVNLLRRLGLRLMIAAIVAVAAVLSRPLISQIILAKDDLFVAAFLIALLNAMTAPRDRTNPLPTLIAGVALGLLVATKYTAIYALPIGLVMIDAPWRCGWRGRKYLAAFVIALALAGGWYIRNWLLTGNPLYPMTIGIPGATIFPGMLRTSRSGALATAAGLWRIFAHGYYSPVPLLLSVLFAGWIAAMLRALMIFASHGRNEKIAGKFTVREPLWRAVLLGPPLIVALFILTSPYAEIRFVYPALVLLFAAFGIAVDILPAPFSAVLAGGLVVLCAGTAFPSRMAWHFSEIVAVVGIVACIVAIAWQVRWIDRRIASTCAVIAAFAISISVYVYWHAYVARYDQMTPAIWANASAYDGQADIWQFVRRQLPPDASIAYTNTYFVYPLLGFSYGHRAFYVPTRKDLNNFLEMPPIEKRLTGEEIPEQITELLEANPDRWRWLSRLRRSGAQYLVVFTIDPADPQRIRIPPEQRFASEDPEHFELVYPSDGRHAPGAVYRIRWPD